MADDPPRHRAGRRASRSRQPRLCRQDRALDPDAETDLFAYPDRLPAEWKAFRRARLTALVARIRLGVRAARSRALLTSAVTPDFQDAFDERMQDWRGWLSSRLIDAVAPM